MDMDTQCEVSREQISTEKKNHLRKYDLIFFIILLVICGFGIGITWQIPFKAQLTWPGMLPMFLLCMIILMICATLITEYIPNPGFRSNFGSTFDLVRRGLLNFHSPFYRGFWVVLCLLGYRLILVYFPKFLPPTYSYIIGTAALSFILIISFRAARVWLAILTAVLTTIALTVIFGQFYRVPLP